MELKEERTKMTKKVFRLLNTKKTQVKWHWPLMPAEWKSLDVSVCERRSLHIKVNGHWVNLVNLILKNVCLLKLSAHHSLPFELELPVGVYSHVTDFFFMCICLTVTVYVLCATHLPPFSPPPGKLAPKTGAQRAAKRSRQPLSTPNACAAGYPPTPC